MITPDRLSSIGKFQRTHALRGELNAILEVDDDFLIDNPWIIVIMEGIPTPFHVESIRPKSASTSLVKLSGIDTEAAARVFVNHSIMADGDILRNYLGDNPDGMYASDFIGYRLIDATGNIIGPITDVNLASEENPLFQVETKNGKNVLVPAADNLIMSYDLEEKTITMTLPEGLFDL